VRPLLARLGSTFGAARPDMEAPGRGSLVAVVEFYHEEDERFRGVTHQCVHAVDEWGRVLSIAASGAYSGFEVLGGLPDDWTVEMLKGGGS
jgi:hypothetical protein